MIFCCFKIIFGVKHESQGTTIIVFSITTLGYGSCFNF